MKSFVKTTDVRRALWLLLIVVLSCCFFVVFFDLERGLVSVFDEGFFFLQNQPNELFTVQTRPLSLSRELQQRLFPNISEWDVLTLRRVAYLIKFSGIMILVFSALFFLRNIVTGNDRVVFSLELVGCVLLVGLFRMPTVVLSGNTLLFFSESIVLSISLLAVSVGKKWLRNLLVVALGFFVFVSLLCNAPAGVMLLVLSFSFLLFYDGSSGKKAVTMTTMMCSGLLLAMLVTHFLLISLGDICQFVRMALNQTTMGGEASHHSFMKVFLVVLFGIRDIMITTLLLLGIVFLLTWVGKKSGKKWFFFMCAIVLFYIVQKWQVKPRIYLSSTLTCAIVLYVMKLVEKGANPLKNRLFVLCAYLYLMPLLLSFGTNTTIMDRAMHLCLPWGMLIFLLGKENEGREIKMSKNGDWLYVFFVAILLIPALKGLWHERSYETFVFDKEKPIARMKLTSDQYDFYTEVWNHLKEYDYSSQRDTLLGFCNNEMTVVAMDAIPYTNDQQPTEFTLHDVRAIRMPSFMILSEWDKEYLEPYFDSIWTNYREAYDVFEMKHNPDPGPGGALQSTLYLRKDRKLQ